MRDPFDLYLQHIEDAIYLLKCMDRKDINSYRRYRKSVASQMGALVRRLEEAAKDG